MAREDADQRLCNCGMGYERSANPLFSTLPKAETEPALQYPNDG